MLFGDDALYVQIVHDAHDPDPAIAWRNRPFTRSMARTNVQSPSRADRDRVADRLGAGVRAVIQRRRSHLISGAACCTPAWC